MIRSCRFTVRAGFILLAVGGTAVQSQAQMCKRTITADVAAFEQNLYFNRLGAMLPEGMLYALRSDLVSNSSSSNGQSCAGSPNPCQPGHVILRPDKRPRPMVLRANVGDCLAITFTNYIAPLAPPATPPGSQTYTRSAGIHVTGLELVGGINSDSSAVGANPAVGGGPGSLVAPGQTGTYTYYAKAEGNYLLYSFDDADPGQLASGLFGAVNVEPEGAEWYRSQVTHDQFQSVTFMVSQMPASNRELSWKLEPRLDQNKQQERVMMGGVQQNVQNLITEQIQPEDKHTTTIMPVVAGANGFVRTMSGHPLINYDAMGPDQKPVLSMLNPPHVAAGGTGAIVYTDLTAIITGPYADRFPFNSNGPQFRNNPALPDRREPYREFSIFYHMNNQITQAFSAQYNPTNGVTGFGNTIGNGQDGFAINYGSGGIGSEILANRLGVGPEKDCVECKFEEFFLSSWAVGDPAMVTKNVPTPGGGSQLTADYPDDPSNVYHSYVRDHVKFRIFNASASEQPHVHHQHAHQWLHTANDDSSTYLDSQMIVPGSAYTLDMVYNGSGNRNGTIGDSIFHCHFYPHFAQGMWSLWRVHDVFEDGTAIDPATQAPKTCNPTDNTCWNRALPDGEITTGTPIPGLVPLPTQGMAPTGANVKLVDNGRRALVQPLTASAGSAPTYNNPGYPFFVPGYAGHRPPHPPMDFAAQLDKNGNKITLDGGLPRHILLGGQYIREFHTIFDFSKDFSAQKAGGGGLAVGQLYAEQLPEEGTPVEQAAMTSQSRRTVATSTPEGLPGNFTLNGLPPVSGAPFARPEANDSGTDVSNARRYQAAVVQRDVVLNKDGWHYPQQRFLTLWNDVDQTMDGTRPPQPLFFRITTGETVEFWHTNLVPSYYDLDNFQVRTPTDIIGQHIHLVKFDVLASDGAANGFNYEDGTFSPDEVRERIAAINNVNGMYNFNPACWSAPGTSTTAPNPLLACIQAGSVSPLQQTLTALTVAQSNYPFHDPTGAWTGAQTTIQRWDTDPLLNNEGRDRTMRTVFTHDHFGPSTHQNVGLYAGLVIEPDNSTWQDPETGEFMYCQPGTGTTPPCTRTDGGPTSWQAIIHAGNPAESYREFMLEYQDSQLAYLPTSIPKEQPPQVGSLFTTQQDVSAALTSACVPSQLPQACPAACPAGPNQVCCQLQQNFCQNGIQLTSTASVANNSSGNWTITDHSGTDQYSLVTSGSAQSVTVTTMPNAWFDANNTAINTQTPGGCGACVNIINGPGTPPGTYSVNYRNDPVPLRVWNGSNNSFGPTPCSVNSHKSPPCQPPGLAGDLSYAFVSMLRADNLLNVQPDNGGSIGSSGFQFPACPLTPTAGLNAAACPVFAPPSQTCATNPGSCVQPTDPYTPTLRAFQGDRVQVRVLVGAHVQTHPFLMRGLKWLFEPSAVNSGYRNAQDTGLSEHFEFLFRVPFSAQNAPLTAAADYLYQPSSGLSGTSNGLWGLLRAYAPSSAQVGLLPLPAEALQAPPQTAIPACPADAPIKTFDVIATTATQSLPNGQLTYNSRNSGLGNSNALVYVLAQNRNQVKSGALAAEPLMLRVNAGDCVKITLTNEFSGTGAVFTTAATAPEAKTDPKLSASFSAGGVPPTFFPFDQPPLQGSLGISLFPSPSVGLSPSLVAYDISTNAGFNIGLNATQTILPGGQGVLTWYAGNVSMRDGNPSYVPVEFGAVNLLPSDPMMQEANGLAGVLIVEPRGAKIDVDGGTQAAATVSRTVTEDDGTSHVEFFREFVVVTEDDTFANLTNNPTTLMLFNYRSEPATQRYQSVNATSDLSLLFSNLLLAGSANPNGLDPQTPVFAAPAGAPVRFRMLHPGGDTDQVMAVHGHSWQEEPYADHSRVIGYNPLSNWFGTQEFGANDRFEMVIGKAGGTFQIPGDYLYHALQGEANSGLWGLLRVTPDAVTVTAAQLTAGTLTASGSVSKPVNGAPMATTLTVSMVTDLPGGGCPTTGMRPCIQPLGTANVGADGSWSSSISNVTLPAGAAVRFQSNVGGQRTVDVPYPGP
jgi:manganese oxidase